MPANFNQVTSPAKVFRVPQVQKLASFFNGSVVPPLAILVFVCLLGCEGGTGTPSVIVGRLESKGKAVYPAVVMLKDPSGFGLSGNTDNQGNFRIYNPEKKLYQVAVEPIRLAGISAAERQASQQPRLDPDGFPIREETLPPEFQNANIEFSSKFFTFDTSGLTIDCRGGVPSEPVVLRLD
jgi:hypothetical protein